MARKADSTAAWPAFISVAASCRKHTMHPFLVWLLATEHDGPSAADRLQHFSSQRRIFRDIPKDDLEQLLNLTIGWKSYYEDKYPGRHIGQDTAEAWAQYTQWLAEVSAKRLTL